MTKKIIKNKICPRPISSQQAVPSEYLGEVLRRGARANFVCKGFAPQTLLPSPRSKLTGYYKNQNGMTLVEVVIAMGIFSILVLAVSLFAKDVLYFNKLSENALSTEQEARKVIRPMVGEIRSAVTSGEGSFPLEVTSSSTLTFYTDLNGDDEPERVRYFLDNNSLKKGVVVPTGSPLDYNLANEDVSIAINDVVATSTAVFSYYDTNYTGTTSPLTLPVSPSDVRLIKINLYIDPNPSDILPPYNITTQVSIRNLKDNL